MNLDETIIHAKKIAAEYGESMCGNQHKQLAEWLEELRELRQKYKKDNNDYKRSTGPK